MVKMTLLKSVLRILTWSGFSTTLKKATYVIVFNHLADS